MDYTQAIDADEPGSALSEIWFFFFSFFFFFNLTTWMRLFSQINKCQQKKQTNKKNKNKTKQNKKGGVLRF